MISEDKKLNWDLSLLYSSDNDPEIEKDRKIVEEEVEKFALKWDKKSKKGNILRTDYLQDPVLLKEALDEYERFQYICGTDGKEDFYFFLRSSLDENNTDLRAKVNQATEFSQKLEERLQFFTMRIAKILKEDQSKFLNDPLLIDYKHFLSRLFVESKYLLSEAEEKILSLKNKTSYYNWVQMTSGFLTKEKRFIKSKDENNNYIEKELNFSQILGQLDNKDKSIRDSAAAAFNQILDKHSDVAENEINSVLEDKKSIDKLRKVKRPDELRHISDDIDTEVVDSLIQAVTKSFDISKRFYKLKANLLGVKKLEYHERTLEYGEVVNKYEFNEGAELLHKVLNNLSPEFNKIFTEFVEESRIDVYPKEGKSSGAFMANGLKSNPIYILLNYTGKLNDVLTLAHEVGHGIHYTFARKQNSLNAGATISTAEVASTFMEDFVLQEIVKNSDEETRLSIMMMRLNDEISTIIRQVAIYNFETDLHSKFKEKGYLSKVEIGELYTKNMTAYMGDCVEQSEGSQNWWIYISHIRRFFYVYSYASGLLISKSMQNSVKNDKSFIDKVKEYFESGTSSSPKEIFSKMGIDVTDKEFWQNGLDEIRSLLDQTEELARKLKKI